MIGHLLAAFQRLFITRKSRVAVSLLIILTAAVPASEMLVLTLFSSLIIEGPQAFVDDPMGVAFKVGAVIVAFGLSRGTNHLVRLGRVRVYRDSFEEAGRVRTPSQESWEWALAFELSSVLVSLVQVITFGALILLVDWPTGILNGLATVVVLVLLSAIYYRQLDLQKGYVRTGNRAGSIAISRRVGGRLRAAEFGAMLASISMVVVLLYMLIRTIGGDVDSADAIVLFLALRLSSGQLTTLSASMMRFARASAREEGAVHHGG